MRATVFAPGSIGNVGPGFDVLGLAIDEVGDRVTVELTGGPARVAVRGVDAALVPVNPTHNAASIAADAMIRVLGGEGSAAVEIEKGIPVSAGLGGSASSSVAGAYAAALACGVEPRPAVIIAAALAGEMFVSGRHLDNIAPITLGGLVLSRSIDPIDVIRLPVPRGWTAVLLTPNVRIETRRARSILPETWDRRSWVQQMANTAALVAAFSMADRELARRALDDLYAEPLRAPMIPNFAAVKRAALDRGAFGCSISGAGPTIFALVDGDRAAGCADAMREAMRGTDCQVRISRIADRGAHRV
ncbi:MAG TPA: homoserine kinase [Thermoanaerobaculia bacterium]|nr:homoserine kinase [Thermoanaerobaculia bacterium]